MRSLQALLLTGFSLLFLACCGLAPGCCQGCDDGQACTAGTTQADEWQSLIEGESTAGWLNYNKDTISDGWQVIDGALTMTGGGGDIVTTGTYKDFELELEWQVAEGGNSGIFFNVQPGEHSVWATGPEMQVLDNTKHQDGKNPSTSAGACYALYEPVRDVTKPVGEWNQARLVSSGGHVEHWLNGTKLCEYELGGDDWNAKVTASKFNDMPKFGKFESGHLALQDHGDRVAFRNIRVRRL